MKHKLPCKAYWDSGSGLVRVEVIEVTRKKDSLFRLASGPGDANTDVTVKFRVTALKNKTWKHGEVLTTSGTTIFPRACYHPTGIFTYRADAFEWESK